MHTIAPGSLLATAKIAGLISAFPHAAGVSATPVTGALAITVIVLIIAAVSTAARAVRAMAEIFSELLRLAATMTSYVFAIVMVTVLAVITIFQH